MLQLPTRIREADLGDLAFVLDTIARSLRNSPAYKECSNDVFYSGFRQYIEPAVMSSPILVACNPECEDQIYGYISYQQESNSPMLNYVYVKQVYRGMGIGTKLMAAVCAPSDVLRYKFTTPAMVNFMRHCIDTGVLSNGYYNPFINWE
jgi:GNAT superfamily N-acetyltransferase